MRTQLLGTLGLDQARLPTDLDPSARFHYPEAARLHKHCVLERDE